MKTIIERIPDSTYGAIRLTEVNEDGEMLASNIIDCPPFQGDEAMLLEWVRAERWESSSVEFASAEAPQPKGKGKGKKS